MVATENRLALGCHLAVDRAAAQLSLGVVPINDTVKDISDGQINDVSIFVYIIMYCD